MSAHDIGSAFTAIELGLNALLILVILGYAIHLIHTYLRPRR